MVLSVTPLLLLILVCLVSIRIVCLLQHLSKQNSDVVKRWVNEAQEAANSDNIMVQVGGCPFLLYRS